MSQPTTTESQATPPSTAVPAPTTTREVQILRDRSEQLREELEGLTELRSQLAAQILGSADVAKPGLERRLQVIDDRIVQMERDLSEVSNRVSAASPEVLAQVGQRESAHTGPSDDDMVGAGFGGFFLGILVMLLAARIRRWRRRGERAAPRTEIAPDPRIERLTQAVDAIAVEVERIGEGQRFVTQLLAEPRPRGAAFADAGATADALSAPNRSR